MKQLKSCFEPPSKVLINLPSQSRLDIHSAAEVMVQSSFLRGRSPTANADLSVCIDDETAGEREISGTGEHMIMRGIMRDPKKKEYFIM